ncbi:uncharacterized protein BCR38DRAFT_203774 [Pseudomassariella vexata]|uniref:Uncharacterized protein n=1 Tax=Pseudomassariella vexata TaxID=1141098 RepID=A0A1Y2DXG2_9PEZI|nr:uncharacterized protein BCR38DRAFT_203774 [Pseudomassariella vexata]ORY63990.1 hypothetical protein BCR38DRAFT_203774 [Pseudomassariella vexata]
MSNLQGMAKRTDRLIRGIVLLRPDPSGFSNPAFFEAAIFKACRYVDLHLGFQYITHNLYSTRNPSINICSHQLISPLRKRAFSCFARSVLSATGILIPHSLRSAAVHVTSFGVLVFTARHPTTPFYSIHPGLSAHKGRSRYNPTLYCVILSSQRNYADLRRSSTSISKGTGLDAVPINGTEIANQTSRISLILPRQFLLLSPQKLATAHRVMPCRFRGIW